MVFSHAIISNSASSLLPQPIQGKAADRGGRRHGAATTVAQNKSMSWAHDLGANQASRIVTAAGSHKSCPKKRATAWGWRPRKRVTTRGWKRLCLWSSPSETTRLGDSDFSTSSPQRHALLLLPAGI